jgi:uncharacterized protein VirK/YbjX
MQQPSTLWPEYRTLLAVDKTKILNIGRRMRLAWAVERSKKFRSLIDGAVLRCPWVRSAMDRHPILFRPLMSRFLDPRLSSRQLFTYYAHDLEFTSTHINRAFPNFFSDNLSERLWIDQAHGYSVDLSMNLAHPQEGLWQLSLRSPNQTRLFSMCFSILPGPMIFVGSVQGGRSDDSVNLADLIRSATKDFEGMRPHFLLFDVVRTLAANWKIESLTGIANRNQLKAHSHSKNARAVRFSYDTFFHELGATRMHDGNWDVPLTLQAREIADAPSRKRAMYRRRITLMTGLREQVSAFLTGFGSAPMVQRPAYRLLQKELPGSQRRFDTGVQQL